VTTTFFLVRHAAHDRVGTVLCGRMPGVTLGTIGKAQAERLGERFANENVASVQTSPLERARETAAAIAVRKGVAAAECDGISEINFGTWTGLTFENLEQDPAWRGWNTARSVTCPPGGESMLHAQMRIVRAMAGLRRAHPDRAVVLVSHGDVIKAAVLYHLGLPIDAYSRFDIDPASVSTLVVGDWGSRLIRLNEVIAA
jgi:broad specificity phosphatase PhoE